MFHPSTAELAQPALTSNADSSPLALIRPLDELLGVGIPVSDNAAVNAGHATTYDPDMTGCKITMKGTEHRRADAGGKREKNRNGKW
jgi:hypothetical protein